MDEAQEILLSSLESSGVALPPGVSSARGLSPDALLSISAQCLRLIDPSSPPLPASLPASAADRFKACTDVAAAVRSLGYRGQLTFRQLLYPSDDDSYKLLRFLVEVLSESSEGSKNAGKKLIGDKGGGGQAPDQSNDSVYTEQFRSKQECHSCGKEGSQHPHESEMDGRDPTFEKDMLSQRSDEYSVKLVEKLDSLHRQVSEMKSIDEDQQSQERLLMEDVHAKASEVQDLEYVFAILKVLSEMAFYDCRRTELYIEELNKRVEARRCNLLELESQWNEFEKSFDERRVLLEQSMYADKAEELKKCQQLEEIMLETDAIFSEIHKRDEEYSKLAEDLEKLPKVPTRRSYIQRITEITKNSQKQDADIDRIIKDTRELQIESNSISERLHRIYAVVDETVFREAKSDPVKRDPVRKNIYRLLKSIHDSFEQIADKILVTDRTQRESADLEAKLAGLTSRSVDIEKLQADLDAIVEENELLEQHPSTIDL